MCSETSVATATKPRITKKGKTDHPSSRKIIAFKRKILSERWSYGKNLYGLNQSFFRER